MRNDFHIGAAAALVAIACTGFLIRPAQSQSLVEMYRSARFQAQVERIFERYGVRAEPRPLQSLPYVSESVRRQMAVIYPPPAVEPPPVEEPSIRIEKTSLTPRLGAGWFEREFAETQWSFIGSNTFDAIDTTYTRDLRAMLEAHFGSPTRTIADISDTDDESREYIQFQYWFVLNDTIPVKVMDVNGTFERGVVVATDQSYRNVLPDLKAALLQPALNGGRRAPYVDYYYLMEQGMWFLTGFDGERFFVDRISRPNLRQGRPRIEDVRTP
ncbi:MAG: hypothetical protein WD423_00810 [Rhodothermales bacterium]